jgi:D-aminopeptidase
VPVGKELREHLINKHIEGDNGDGSCMIVVATDAPLTSRNLERLASRAILGLGRTGGIESNGSGDYVIAFSTAESVRVPHQHAADLVTNIELKNDAMSVLFQAVIEATEEAIINSLFTAETMTGRNGLVIEALPVEKVIAIIRTYQRIKIY